MERLLEVQGHVEEIVEFYDPEEHRSFKSGNRDRFPKDSRLAYCVYKQPNYYFGETVYARKLIETGHICWQERYQLFQPVGPRSQYYDCSAEIKSLLGEDIVRILHEYGAQAAPKLVNPDVVAFHPGKRRWGFFEIKLRTDKIRPNQICSLGVLGLVTGGDVAVVRLVPMGTHIEPSKRKHNFIFQVLNTACSSNSSVDNP
ncbi:MAG: hypothetical protein ABSG91_04060 [Syntrophobacteraceae bacterium]